MTLKRCSWVKLNNPLYVKYHDEEWGKLVKDEQKLFELLILETFQAGLSWECVLNKREAFRQAFDNFDLNKIANYDEKKINLLLNNPYIIRNKLKIKATINNAKIYRSIQNEFQSFNRYLQSFAMNNVIYEIGKTKSELSDKISKDLYKRGMRFVVSTIIYSYLQAIGIINSHETDCFCYKK